MKKGIIAFAALMAGAGLSAQTEVTTGVMQGKDYGVTYMLPHTEIEFVLQVTKHIYTPGEFCKYADRYLRLNNISAQAEEYWTLDKIETRTAGVPDREKVYFVKMKDKTVAPLMELTEDGIVRSINLPFSGQKPETKKGKEENSPQSIDPRSFLTEEILIANSSAKMAELVAKEIYTIRESRNALLRGEADNMPQDGAQLKLMLDNLNQQERAMTEMFAGTQKEISQDIIIRLVPKEMKDEVAFRFSRKLGVVDKDDLAGEPYYVTIVNQNTPSIPEPVESKKKLEGVVYNVPGKARVTLSHGNRTLFDEELNVTQFGTQEYLAPVLFNKNSTIKVLFDTTTGGLIKVERE